MPIKIPIEVSARHVHISQKDLEKLFGKSHKLKSIKKLSQEDDFASSDELELINGKNKLKARVLGPPRKKTQVEISVTDAHNLDLKQLPPINLSGNLKQALPITLKGPKRKINVKGLIIAKRHLHCKPKDAKRLKLKNNQKIKIKVTGPRSVIFDEIIVRIKPKYKLALHLDTDEANSAGIKGKGFGELVR